MAVKHRPLDRAGRPLTYTHRSSGVEVPVCAKYSGRAATDHEHRHLTHGSQCRTPRHRPECSVRSRSSPVSVFTEGAIKPTFGSAAGAGPSGSYVMDS